MSDPFIDQYETQSYGPFAVSQVESLAVGVDPSYDSLLTHLSGLVTRRTAALGDLLERADDHVAVTYKPAKGETDHVVNAVNVIRKLAKYADSRDDGEAIVEAILGGRTLTALAKLRPARLPEVIDTAVKAVDKHREELPEHAAWTKRLRAAHKNVTDLNVRVRSARNARREMTPEIAASRDAWLGAYAALKLAVESLLRLHGKLRLMPEIFDDLAEIHRAPNVSDGEAPAQPALPPPTGTPHP